MIIVKIKSGIGNQFFQYAFGRWHSVYNKTELALDIMEYDRNTFMHKTDSVKYRLNKFKINEVIVNEEQLKQFTEEIIKPKSVKERALLSRLGIISKVIKRGLYFWKNFINIRKNYICETNPFLSNKGKFYLRKNAYYDGYWGGYLHLNMIREQLLAEFQLKNDVKTEGYAYWINKISSTNNSVAIHVRSLSGSLSYRYEEFFGIPQLEYYYAAIELIANKISNPVFFIFTDHWEWTKNNFKTNYPMFFIKDVGIEEDYLDSDFLELDLMSKCEHNIIINSTFSWWAAWLNSNLQKIVIAPSKWFKDKKSQRKYEKGLLVPKEWIKI